VQVTQFTKGGRGLRQSSKAALLHHRAHLYQLGYATLEEGVLAFIVRRVESLETKKNGI